MKELYLVGEPCIKVVSRKEYFAPISQLDISQKVLRETQDTNVVLGKLCEEYLAIVWSLKEMGIDFRIIYSHPDEIDEKILGVCIESLKCRLVAFDPGYFPPSVIYPRDLATVLPGVILVNSHYAKVLSNEKNGWKILSSPYGEGGRVLACQRTILISERLVLKHRHSVRPRDRELKEITNLGIRIGLFPPFVSQPFSGQRKINKPFFNDHSDRVACLLLGKDGNLHLVVDPQIQTIDWKGRNRVPPWIYRYPKESLEKIETLSKSLGIKVHCPKELRVPYSLNLIQFPDGRVLMTSGDDSLEETIREIVGEEKIFKTPVPIRFFPVWLYAGIRCLVNEAPLPLLKKRDPNSIK